MSPGRPRFIVFEGLDGTGKSTLAARVAQALHARLISTPPRELRPVRSAIDDAFSSAPAASQLFYASTVLLASEQARELVAAGFDVVCDRYWLTTRAYDALRPGHLDLRALEPRLLPADVTVLVETDEGERHRRLALRGATAADRKALDSGALLARRYRELLSGPLAGCVVSVDTTSRTEDDCARELAALLERL